MRPSARNAAFLTVLALASTSCGSVTSAENAAHDAGNIVSGVGDKVTSIDVGAIAGDALDLIVSVENKIPGNGGNGDSGDEADVALALVDDNGNTYTTRPTGSDKFVEIVYDTTTTTARPTTTTTAETTTTTAPTTTAAPTTTEPPYTGATFDDFAPASIGAACATVSAVDARQFQMWISGDLTTFPAEVDPSTLPDDAFISFQAIFPGKGVIASSLINGNAYVGFIPFDATLGMTRHSFDEPQADPYVDFLQNSPYAAETLFSFINVTDGHWGCEEYTSG